MRNVLWGSHIRIFELTRSLGVQIIHGGGYTRFLEVVKNTSKLLKTNRVLIFDYWTTPYDFLFLNFLKRKSGLIFDIADIPYLQPIYFNGQKNINMELLKKVQKKFLWLISISNILLFISPTEFNLLNINLKGKKIIFVPNAANPYFFSKTPIQKNKRKTILYVGGYVPARGVDILIEAFYLLRKKRKDIALKLVGASIPQGLQRDGIVVEPNKFYPDMPKTYSESYLCVIPHKKNPYMDAALPIKLFDAMAAARPVVVTNCYEMARLVNSEKCGFVAEDNAESLAETIGYLVSDDSLAREMGEKGREAVEKKHSWKHRAQTIIKNIE